MKLERVLENFAQSLDEYYGQLNEPIEVVLPAEIYDRFHDEYMKEAAYLSPAPRLNATAPTRYVFRSGMGNRIELTRREFQRQGVLT